MSLLLPTGSLTEMWEGCDAVLVIKAYMYSRCGLTICQACQVSWLATQNARGQSAYIHVLVHVHMYWQPSFCNTNFFFVQWEGWWPLPTCYPIDLNSYTHSFFWVRFVFNQNWLYFDPIDWLETVWGLGRWRQKAWFFWGMLYFNRKRGLEVTFSLIKLNQRAPLYLNGIVKISIPSCDPQTGVGEKHSQEEIFH